MSDLELRKLLIARIEAVEARIRAACDRAGRRREEVQLVAVTKTISDRVLPLLPELGLRLLGENRPQELWRKTALLKPSATLEWDFIGHLQRNKIERTLPLVRLIHSVDSVRLLKSLESAGKQWGYSSLVLLEVNTSGESTKQGFAPQDLSELLPYLSVMQFVSLAGLMTMAAPEADPQKCRPSFSLLRSLRDQLAAALDGRFDLPDLSMGMSNDFEVAIEEGATLVRIGSALFEGLSQQPG